MTHTTLIERMEEEARSLRRFYGQGHPGAALLDEAIAALRGQEAEAPTIPGLEVQDSTLRAWLSAGGDRRRSR